jgi:hypothetical protein
MGHLIVCSAKLEAEHREHILPLEKYSALHAIAEIDSMVKR